MIAFAENKGFASLVQTFVTTNEWTEVVLSLSGFGGIDGHDLTALIFSGGPAAGAFAFQIDDVRFR